MPPELYTIVVVDDNALVNAALTELLESAGYHVVSCLSGVEAYKVAARIKPHVVVTDLAMEVPDAGFRLLEQLRGDPVTHKVGVIVCSANAYALHAGRRQAAEMEAHLLRKPFNISHLLETIRHLLVAQEV